MAGGQKIDEEKLSPFISREDLHWVNIPADWGGPVDRLDDFDRKKTPSGSFLFPISIGQLSRFRKL